MSGDGFDTRLRQVSADAQKALLRMDGHEALCAQRYASISANTTQMMESIERTNHLLLGVGGTLLVGMAGILVKQLFFSP